MELELEQNLKDLSEDGIVAIVDIDEARCMVDHLQENDIKFTVMAPSIFHRKYIWAADLCETGMVIELIKD